MRWLIMIVIVGCASSELPPDAGVDAEAVVDACELNGCEPVGAAHDARAAELGCEESYVCPGLIGANVCCAPSAISSCIDGIHMSTDCFALGSALANCSCW